MENKSKYISYKSTKSIRFPENSRVLITKMRWMWRSDTNNLTHVFFVSYLTHQVNCLLGIRCPRCGKQYKKRDSLYCHLRRDCGVERSYTCTYGSCVYNTRSYTPYNFKKHLYKIHPEEYWKYKRRLLP